MVVMHSNHKLRDVDGERGRIERGDEEEGEREEREREAGAS